MSSVSSSSSSEEVDQVSDYDSDASSEIITSFVPVRPIKPLPRRSLNRACPQIIILEDKSQEWTPESSSNSVRVRYLACNAATYPICFAHWLWFPSPHTSFVPLVVICTSNTRLIIFLASHVSFVHSLSEVPSECEKTNMWKVTIAPWLDLLVKCLFPLHLSLKHKRPWLFSHFHSFHTILESLFSEFLQLGAAKHLFPESWDATWDAKCFRGVHLAAEHLWSRPIRGWG